MRRRLLVIAKEPEFDSRGEVVLGQCEPFTSGWSLTLITPERQREQLVVGTYMDLRRMQEACRDLEEPAAIRLKIQDLRSLFASSLSPAIVDAGFEALSSSQADSSTRLMCAVPEHTPGGLLELQPNNGVLVATVVQPERASEIGYLKDELLALLECRPRAVLVDVGKVLDFSPRSFEELAGIGSRLKEGGTRLAICGVTAVQQDSIKHLDGGLTIYENKTVALDALKS